MRSVIVSLCILGDTSGNKKPLAVKLHYLKVADEMAKYQRFHRVCDSLFFNLMTEISWCTASLFVTPLHISFPHFLFQCSPFPSSQVLIYPLSESFLFHSEYNQPLRLIKHELMPLFWNMGLRNLSIPKCFLACMHL